MPVMPVLWRVVRLQPTPGDKQLCAFPPDSCIVVTACLRFKLTVQYMPDNFKDDVSAVESQPYQWSSFEAWSLSASVKHALIILLTSQIDCGVRSGNIGVLPS